MCRSRAFGIVITATALAAAVTKDRLAIVAVISLALCYGQNNLL